MGEILKAVGDACGGCKRTDNQKLLALDNLWWAQVEFERCSLDRMPKIILDINRGHIIFNDNIN